MLRTVESILLERELVEKDDMVIIVAGIPMGVTGRTNMLKLHRIGELS